MRATVTVPGQDPVSKEAEAPFSVGTERIDVSAQKRFTPLGDENAETENLTGVTAGDSVGVVLRALNADVPRSTVLDSLRIVEPGEGSNARFFGDDLRFGGFDMSTPERIAAAWPAGATGAVVTWSYDDGTTATDEPTAGEAMPAPATGKTVTGFEVVFTGAIAPGAVSELRYRLDSSVDEDFVPAGGTSGKLRNTIDVTGAREGLDPDEASASATVAYVAPRIDASIDKRVGPGVVLPGQQVVVQLGTEVKTDGGRTKPTRIVVEDALAGDGTFWDAFDAKRILPPISRPTTSAGAQASLLIEYRDAAGTWKTLVVNPDADTAVDVEAEAGEEVTGLRFVYANVAGFDQVTYVKPNILFEARDELRSSGKPTAGAFDGRPEAYENTASVEATGKLDERTVTGEDEDRASVGIRGEEGGPGPEGLWAGKTWQHDALTSQSGASSWTTQRWAVTREGYSSAVLQDPASPTASGEGTVFEAFDLTHVRPIRTSGPVADATVDPMLRWDLVTAVELWDGARWVPVAAPSGGWTDAGGFVGYTLTAAEREWARGVRLILAENTAAREAAAEAGDLTAPAAGSGIAASGELRSFRLDWKLRDRARTADGSLKWVKEKDTSFNCDGGGDGCVDNVFRLSGTTSDGAEHSDTANDTIQVIDAAQNVALDKRVQALGVASTPCTVSAAASDCVQLVVPNAGELDPADYPRARYTLTTRNSSER
ncbi:hypothetical protein [Leucobacter ruminantium]|uniref:Uncharacterized protein n=1 Tax=Leucobacter ruminantium TaxID=1289170 RepID=A0A939RV76_9MICO|nr:hypothetical protein [Leucobacter ruminantium]MBO1806615.1 hypothetical protein [Leucobacter ruminantium]